MNRLEKNFEILHDLLQIQQDRAATYGKLLLNGHFDDKINMVAPASCLPAGFK